ncbi:putative geraniol 8-hydroxylase [Iris pallida]|uniref:Geraniol 8-hydroxylase n=1 Tax=Iris pallida TaxID=29817 RepID=A0AAX6GWT2_IRIPA|nr:putative geraniol 8-hydroxylase [Iris pallida]
MCSLISMFSGVTPSGSDQSKASRSVPMASGSIRDMSDTAGHIRLPDPKGMNSKC